MNAKLPATLLFIAAILLATPSPSALASGPTYSWRYYRIGNTGIQGDYCDAVWIGPDGDPYIGGYNPSFEEGGFSKFIQSENRWINYSNVDYPVIGHPDDTGTTRVNDIVPDATGKLWMATWRGALTFDPEIGEGSLTYYRSGNSALSDSGVEDIEQAPDGTMWFVSNGIARFDPATHVWTHWNVGNLKVAAQPKPTGGYLIWSSATPPYQDFTLIFDSDTQRWTTHTWEPQGPANQVVGLPGLDCVDDSGNLWALRTNAPGDWNSVDYRRPDGAWVTPPEPYAAFSFSVWAFKAYGDSLAIAVDGSGTVYQFDGSTWNNFGVWRPGAYSYSADVDGAGNVWVCGVGGAAKRDVLTGQWQRYRVTNTCQYDSFNNDLTIDPYTGDVYACANAAPGIGGMVKFDSQRWTGINNLHYGLGIDWPFTLTDSSEAVHVRPSNGRVVVNPLNYFTSEFDGSSWMSIPGGPDQVQQYVEDSLGRLWGTGHYGGLGIYENGGYIFVSAGDWFSTVKLDSDRPGTVWSNLGWQILRTDGKYSISWMIGDFPEASGLFTGLAVDHNGIAWVGTWGQFNSAGSTLIRLDANTGAYQVWQHDLGWPFPGEHVRPLTVTSDGRIWMLYDSEYPSNDAGLLWWDGTNIGTFPAPPGGIPQWGGLPHAGIKDLEVKLIPNGYELWMSCISRGIAVLSVTTPPIVGDVSGDGAVNVDDLLAVINSWGTCAAPPSTCPADLTGDGTVNVDDLLVVINNWT